MPAVSRASAKEKVAGAKKATATETKVVKKAPAATKKVAPAAKKVAVAKKTATVKAPKPETHSDKENARTKRRRSATAEDESLEEKTTTTAQTQLSSDDEDNAKMANEKKTTGKRAAAHKDESAAKRQKIAKPARVYKTINTPPTQVMDIFVFGEGSSGELGLGHLLYDGKKPIDVKRPRLNHNLQGVVQVACGGMHVAVLTKENKIFTWGVNDQGTLGRDTTWDGGLRDVDAEASDSEDDEDTGLNPRESTPAEIDTSAIPEGTIWAQVVASDSATFALTTTGFVYGWGTFRSNEGILGFNRSVHIQKVPTLIPEINKIVQIAAGSNHILALDEKNKIFAWGAGQQAQLARRLLERDEIAGLYPSGVGALPKRAKASKLSCGSYHSFVVDTKGRVIGWGLNNYAELGVSTEAGVDGGYIMKPQIIEALEEYNIARIAGGEHHSLACTQDGKLITWGRIDGDQVGQPKEAFTKDNTIYDDRDHPRILVVPTVMPDIENVVFVTAGVDNSFAVTEDGKVYSWGFSGNYQTGQGTTDDIETPTLIDNTAIRNRQIVFAGAGGQYSILGALQE